MECRFSPLANTDLEEIADYIALDNPQRALSFVCELRERCEKLMKFPNSCPLRPELGEGIRLLAYGRYVICYSVSDTEVRIERIVPASRNLPSLFGH